MMLPEADVDDPEGRCGVEEARQGFSNFQHGGDTSVWRSTDAECLEDPP